MTIRSVPHLFTVASGVDCAGPYTCYYCGAPCGSDHPTSAYVKASFTGRNSVRSPGSPAVCAGCVLCLREAAEIRLIDGTCRTLTQCAMRGWSWVVTAHTARAANKAHIDRLRAACLDPPEPPFALVLSDSGQTHQLYRGVVNHARDHVVVTLEATPVAYRPAELADRLVLCGRLAAATGKPALAEPVSARFAIAVLGRYRDGEALVDLWSRVREQPLSRLAAWLTPRKEDCLREYPSDLESEPEPVPAVAAGPADAGHGSVPPQAGRSGRSRPHAGSDRKGGHSGCGHPLLFHPGQTV